MVHEDEWTVGQAALAPQERNQVGVEFDADGTVVDSRV